MVNPAGVLAYLLNNGTANTFSDGASGYSGMDLHTGRLSLISGNNSTLSALNAALGLTLGGNAGPNFLFTLPGGQLTTTSGTSLTLASTTASFSVDEPLNNAGDISHYLNR